MPRQYGCRCVCNVSVCAVFDFHKVICISLVLLLFFSFHVSTWAASTLYLRYFNLILLTWSPVWHKLLCWLVDWNVIIILVSLCVCVCVHFIQLKSTNNDHLCLKWFLLYHLKHFLGFVQINISEGKNTHTESPNHRMKRAKKTCEKKTTKTTKLFGYRPFSLYILWTLTLNRIFCC